MSTQQQKSSLPAKINYVFTDIDDTITSNGKLPASSYAAMWRLYDAGIHVVPVTGRPAGWCDLILRQWPVRAAIGENGAFAFYMENQKVRRLFALEPSLRRSVRKELGDLWKQMRRRFPGIKISPDQFCRIQDLAVDIGEDVPLWSQDRINELLTFAEGLGFTAKASSIHINFWKGNYNKVTMAETLLEYIDHRPLATAIAHSVFVGDSPNDEIFFKSWPNTFGVNNINQFLSRLKFQPREILKSKSAAGFVELTDRILAEDR